MTDHSEIACVWIRGNKNKWERMRSIVRRLHKLGHRVNRDTVFTMALIEGWTIKECEVFRRNHNLWSSFTRYMVMLEPHLYPSIQFRKCPVDNMSLEKNWRNIVHAETFFFAHSWQEARDLWDMQDASAA